MSENEVQQRGRDNSDTRIDDEKGLTEKLRDQAKSESERLIPGTELPGAQSPEDKEIKNETNPNTE